MTARRSGRPRWGVRISEGVQDWLHRFVWQNDRATEAPSHFAFPFRRGALASEATFLTPAHQPKTEKKRERKRQRADRAGVGEKSQRRVADYPLHRLSNQPVFQTEIPPTASVQRTDRAKKKALLSSKLHGGVDEHSEASTRRGTRATSAEVVRSYRAGGRPNCDQERFGKNQYFEIINFQVRH